MKSKRLLVLALITTLIMSAFGTSLALPDDTFGCDVNRKEYTSMDGKGIKIKNEDYTLHSPIKIDNDTDLRKTAQEEGWAGTGTEDDPYLIRGYEINGTDPDYCIYVADTTEHFLIKDCYLHGAEGASGLPHYIDAGIYLNHVKNGTLKNNSIISCGYGVYMKDSNRNTLKDNLVSKSKDDGILLKDSDKNELQRNNASFNQGQGFHIYHSHWNDLRGNRGAHNEGDKGTYSVVHGLRLNRANNNTVKNNVLLSNEECGVGLTFSDGNLIVQNKALNSYEGIKLEDSNSNIMKKNTVSRIQLSESDSNTLLDNEASEIEIWYCLNNRLVDNEIGASGLQIGHDKLSYWNTHQISPNNTVDGRPIYYWKNRNGGTVPKDAGQVILVNCTGVTLKGQKMGNGRDSILLAFSDNNTIVNNRVSHAFIELQCSDNNTIINNALTSFYSGIELTLSNGNLIRDNQVLNCFYGFDLDSSCNNTLIGNNIYNTSNGISLGSSHSNLLTNNTVLNSEEAIRLRYSDDNTLSNNTLYNNEEGVTLYESWHNLIYHNNFLNNSLSARDHRANQWYKDYPIGGNYWSAYRGEDEYSGADQEQGGSDEVGDSRYNITGGYSYDSYPLMRPYHVPQMIEDTDGDSMNDSWEKENGFDPLDPRDSDEDSDGDDLINKDEFKKGTDPHSGDTDGDGTPDPWEIKHGLDPLDSSDGGNDPDGDGLTNRKEYKEGTSPHSEDTDWDGIDDLWEVKYDLKPNDPSDASKDKDGDGYTNREEYEAGTDPNDQFEHPGRKYSPLILVLTLLSILVIVAAVWYATRGQGQKDTSSKEEKRDKNGLPILSKKGD